MSDTVNQAIPVTRISPGCAGSMPDDLAFGRSFADHMFAQNYADGHWTDARIVPREDLSLHPGAAVLHYSQSVFEGLKAFRRADGGINLFRAVDNARRFNASARRLVMPEVEEAFHVDAMAALVAEDATWVPEGEGAALYVRPIMIATSGRLDLVAGSEYLHYIITGPVGPYFPQGFDPVPVFVSEQHRRAVAGGVGDAKTGGNYAAALKVSEEAAGLGYAQVLWLDAVHGTYVEEVGAMNICFVEDGKRIVTPQLSGSILPGITRDSVLKLAPTLGYEVAEARIDIRDALADIASGRITEVFGCGTAAVIAPVDRLHCRGEDHVVGDGRAGPVSRALFTALTDIQYGRANDPFGWIRRVS